MKYYGNINARIGRDGIGLGVMTGSRAHSMLMRSIDKGTHVMTKLRHDDHDPLLPIDHRTASRYALEVPVEVLLDNGSRLRVNTRDISASGIFVSVASSIRLGDYVRFLITFPREITTACKLLALCDGVVVRREPKETLEGLAIKIERYHFLSSVG